MSPSPRLAVCAGSFDPITLGHVDVIRRSLAFADRVIVAVAHKPSVSKAGLFSVQERLDLIREVFAGEPRVEAAEFQGLLVDFARERGVTLAVRGVRSAGDVEYEMQMARMNRSLAPDLETVLLTAAPELSYLSASLVREVASLGGDVEAFVPAPVFASIRKRFA